MPKLAFKISDRKLLPQIPDCMTTVKTTTQNRGPVRDLWDHTADFQLTPVRVVALIANLLSCALGILFWRTVWGLLAPVMPGWLRVTLVSLYLAVNVAALTLLSLWTWVPAEYLSEGARFEPLDWLLWFLWCGLFVAGTLAVASPWRVTIAIVGILVAAAAGVFLVTQFGDVSERAVPVSVVLLVLVVLLSGEWVSRKMLRLA